LEGQIASGGMATVFHGHRVGEEWGPPVAIKRMHPHCDRDPEFVAMFLDEANLASRIRHPNVVPVLDFAAEGENLIIVMEYVPGDTIGNLVAAAHDARLYPPQRVVASIVTGVLNGLHAAHEVVGDDGQPLNVVHRDISRQNIMVGLDGVARVLDFGVAKATVRFQTTRAGQLKGRIQYMAPEHIRGRGVDRRTDVYSVSVLYWEMISGRSLFEADNAGALMMMVLEGTVPSLRAMDQSVSPKLEHLILKGLSTDPSGRFRTALEMVQAIEQTVGVASREEVAEWVRQVLPQSALERAMRIMGASVSLNWVPTINHEMGSLLTDPPAPFVPPTVPVPPPAPVLRTGASQSAVPPAPYAPPGTQRAPTSPSRRSTAPAQRGCLSHVLSMLGAATLSAVLIWFAMVVVPSFGDMFIHTSRAVFGERYAVWVARLVMRDPGESVVEQHHDLASSSPQSSHSVPPTATASPTTAGSSVPLSPPPASP